MSRLTTVKNKVAYQKEESSDSSEDYIRIVADDTFINANPSLVRCARCFRAVPKKDTSTNPHFRYGNPTCDEDVMVCIELRRKSARIPGVGIFDYSCREWIRRGARANGCPES